MYAPTSFPTVPSRPVRPFPIVVWAIRLAITFAFMSVLALAAALTVTAGFGLRYNDVIYPGVSAWGVDLGGKTPAEAAAALSGVFNYPSQPAIAFTAEGQTFTATPGQLGLTLDLARTVNAAFDVGRSGNLVADMIGTFRAWYGGVQLSPVAIYDEQATLAYLQAQAPAWYVPTAEAQLTVQGSTVTTTPGQIGRQLDVVATAALVKPLLLGLSSGQVPLVFIQTPPLVLDASAQAAAAQSILSAPLTLNLASPQEGDPGPWTIEPAALADMLEVRRIEDGPNAAHYEVGLNDLDLRVFVAQLAEPLRKEGHNAKFLFNDEARQLVLLEDSQDARTLDVEASVAAIHAALAAGEHTVPLVVTITPPEVPGTATAEQLGIQQLVSEQSTDFSGSTAERINNIEVAAERFQGVLVGPGETFSFNEHLGDVSLDTGFSEALIIYGGRTIRGVGGGVCQVSTTVFRAAYFGGFPIEERYSHAYRVGYYERGAAWRGPGLDATVYAPLVDFKFTNDLDAWLLMEVEVNRAAGIITWRFFSTPDGRQVTVGNANVQNVVPAPEPLYEEDPTLAAGVVKQVDYAADGADVSVTRTIMRDGVQINANEPALATHYQPWRAVYNYGPGTPNMPPASGN